MTGSVSPERQFRSVEIEDSIAYSLHNDAQHEYADDIHNYSSFNLHV
jgi:hypothetical protein